MIIDTIQYSFTKTYSDYDYIIILYSPRISKTSCFQPCSPWAFVHQPVHQPQTEQNRNGSRFYESFFEPLDINDNIFIE